MMCYSTRIKGMSMTNTAWKDLKVVLAAPEEWMTFFPCLWAVEEEAQLQKGRLELNPSLSMSR